MGIQWYSWVVWWFQIWLCSHRNQEFVTQLPRVCQPDVLGWCTKLCSTPGFSEHGSISNPCDGWCSWQLGSVVAAQDNSLGEAYAAYSTTSLVPGPAAPHIVGGCHQSPGVSTTHSIGLQSRSPGLIQRRGGALGHAPAYVPNETARSQVLTWHTSK